MSTETIQEIHSRFFGERRTPKISIDVRFEPDIDPRQLAAIAISDGHLWIHHCREFNIAMRDIGYSQDHPPHTKATHKELLETFIEKGSVILDVIRCIKPWPEDAGYDPEGLTVMLDFMKRELRYWHLQPVTDKQAEDFLIALQNNPA